MEIIILSMLMALAVAAVSIQYINKNVQAIEKRDLTRPDYIKIRGLTTVKINL